jgi:hypothetical protein
MKKIEAYTVEEEEEESKRKETTEWGSKTNKKRRTRWRHEGGGAGAVPALVGAGTKFQCSSGERETSGLFTRPTQRHKCHLG